MHDKVTVRTQMCVPINSDCDKVKLQNVSVTLTFEAGVGVLDIYAKLFLNPPMHDKATCVYLLTLMVIMWNCDFDLWGRDVVLGRDTLYWCDRHLCQAISKSLDVWQSYSPGMNDVGTHRQTNGCCNFNMLPIRGHRKGKKSFGCLCRVIRIINYFNKKVIFLVSWHLQ
jgi:hypothetical protein